MADAVILMSCASQGPATAPQHIVVVMPAYNAERTLRKTYEDLPHDLVGQVIVVDDGSEDATVEIAKQLDLRIVVHDRNKGYGANQKTCYVEAMKENATIVAMVHPDYQYDPNLLPDLVAPIQTGSADVVLGSRMMGNPAYKQGMPWWKYLGNKFLTGLENVVFHLRLSEYHTGYRVYTAEVLKSIDFDGNSDDFVFDQEIIAQIVEADYRIVEVPIPVRYFPEASSIGFLHSVIYGCKIVVMLIRFTLRGRKLRGS